MPVVNGYCTEAELRTWMQDSGAILPATVLQDCINAASRGIDSYCGNRQFWADAAPTVRRYKVSESDVAWVDDISDASSITVKTDPDGDNSFSTVWAASDYELSPYNVDAESSVPYAYYRIHSMGNRFFPVNDFRRTLEVTAKFGWSAVPAQVKQACLMKSNMLALRKDSPYGIAGFSEFGVVRINRVEDPEIIRLLAPFVRSNVSAI